MAKARGNRSDMTPKLVFRENGSAKGEGAVIFKENNVREWWWVSWEGRWGSYLAS